MDDWLDILDLATGDVLTPLQQCFIDDGGAQCGICTPGMLVASDALLRSNASPTEDDVRDAIAGNLCRCTGYQRIVDAILNAAARLRDERAATGVTGAGAGAGTRDGGAT